MAVTRRVKIVCTMGPATASPERMLGLVEAGMDVARMNFSHGSHEDHRKVYDLVREAARESGRAVAVTCHPATVRPHPSPGNHVHIPR